MKLPQAFDLAAAVVHLHGGLLPLGLDASGQLTTAYRLGNSRVPLPGATRLEDIDPDLKLHLHPVMARTVTLVLNINGTRSRLKASSLVPLSALSDHLCRAHNLPAGKWRFRTRDGLLPVHLLIDELNPQLELILHDVG